MCERLGLPFRPEVIRYLLDEEHARRGCAAERLPPERRAEPGRGDLPVRGGSPRLDNELVERACRDYFTEL